MRLAELVKGASRTPQASRLKQVLMAGPRETETHTGRQRGGQEVNLGAFVLFQNFSMLLSHVLLSGCL